MADDIMQSAAEHLKRTLDRVVDEQREVPKVTRVRAEDLSEVKVGGMSVEHVEIECDLCEYVAVGPGADGWETPEQPGPPERPDREKVGPYLLCTPCKESWERADYNDLYARCDDRVRDRVDDLAQLAGDTLRTLDPIRDSWVRDHGDNGVGYEW